jgi:hypothetical protein
MFRIAPLDLHSLLHTDTAAAVGIALAPGCRLPAAPAG